MEECGLTISDLYQIFNNITQDTPIKLFDQYFSQLLSCKYKSLPVEYRYYPVESFGYEFGCLYIYINIDESVVEEN